MPHVALVITIEELRGAFDGALWEAHRVAIPGAKDGRCEVYSGVAPLPREFLVDACAVIVIWTKRF